MDSVATIISDAARGLGLTSTDIADPFASTDPNILQMLALLKQEGRALLRVRNWQHLRKEYTFTTSAAASYALPSDYRAMVPQTHWNRTTTFPLGGPLSPSEWQFAQASPVTSTLTILFRPMAGLLYVTPSTSTGATIAYEYLTQYWVGLTGTTSPTKDGPTLASDVVLFDPPLVVAALQLAFLEKKGFDTTAAKDAYDTALKSARDDDSTAPILGLNGSGDSGLLGVHNLPQTGIGS